jgi:hypothetical protein
MRSRNCVRWLYRLPENYSYESGLSLPKDCIFQDRDGTVRLIVEREGRITVTKGYAWNGCSPKILVFDLLFGTPEGAVHVRTERPKTYYASLVHDALYQFLPEGLPMTRRQADAVFLALLREVEFSPARIYWLAVRLLGGFVSRGLRMKRDWNGTVLSVSELEPSIESQAA